MRKYLHTLGLHTQESTSVWNEADTSWIQPMNAFEHSNFRTLVVVASAIQDAASVAWSSLRGIGAEAETTRDSLRQLELEAGIVRASVLGSIEALSESSSSSAALAQSMTRKISERALQCAPDTALESQGAKTTSKSHTAVWSIDCSGQARRLGRRFDAGRPDTRSQHTSLNGATQELEFGNVSAVAVAGTVKSGMSVPPAQTLDGHQDTEGDVTFRLVKVLEVMGEQTEGTRRSRDALLQTLHSRACQIAGMRRRSGTASDGLGADDHMSSESAPTGILFLPSVHWGKL